MTPRFRRVAVFVGAAALAAGSGIGVAASHDDSSSGSSRSAPGISRQQGPRGGGVDIGALADALGVSEARLQEAMQKSRPATPGPGGRDATIQALADQLGLSTDKVRQAFEDAFGSAGPQGTPPTTPS